MNGHYFFCGADTARKQPMIDAAIAFMTAFPSVASDLSAKGANIYVFKDAIDDRVFHDGPKTLAEKMAIYTSYNTTLGETRMDLLAVPPYRRTMVYEGMPNGGVYPNTTATAIATMQSTLFHELGHEFDFSASSTYDSAQPSFGNLVERDQRFMTNTAVSPTAASLRASYPRYYNPPGATPAGVKWVELFAEEVSIRAWNITNIGELTTSDPYTIKYFPCSAAYVKAKMANPSHYPTKADFDSFNTVSDPYVYARCVAPYVPPTCHNVSSTSSYPFQTTALPAAATGWYVYCGVNTINQFENRSGDNLLLLPTSPVAAAWRNKFETAGYSLYVFRDLAQAVSMLGGAAVPLSAQVDGVLGFTQPQILGNATQPFIAMFERVKTTTGGTATYTEHPNTNDMFNYDSGLWRESGRVIDQLVGSAGSTSAAFHTRITGDITRFNLRDGCAASGPDTTLWGSLKSTICNTTTHVKKAPYVGVSNLAIVRGLTVAQLGSGAVKFPPDYQAMFADAPAADNYSLIWAELIGYKRAGGNRGNDFAAMDVWVNTIYGCGKAYAVDGFYVTGAAPIAACP